MRFGVLGTGTVGQTLASKLVELGHEVTMGSRSSGNEKATAWVASTGNRGHEGTFSDAVSFGEVLVNATSGTASLEALKAAGSENIDSKILVDVANPLAFSSDGPPVLSVANTDSLGEQIQAAFPGARVVKTLNTMNCNVMVKPDLVPRPHNVFVNGNDTEAKSVVAGMLQSFGWTEEEIIDLGDIRASRNVEAWVPFWVRVLQHEGSATFNIRVVKP